jgi:hypothetical protein
VELVRRVGVLRERHDGVLERQQHARVDLEREVEVQWTAAALLGMQIDLPHLAKGVGLHEVPLVVDVEAVVNGVVLELGNVPSDVDNRHEGSA